MTATERLPIRCFAQDARRGRDMAYNARKAAQTVAFFAMQEGGSISVLKAVKLVYLGDRESIARTGFPILNEIRVSMPHGPVNSVTYDFMSGVYSDEGWSEFITDKKNYCIGLASAKLSADDLDELSDAEIEALSATWARFGAMNRWEIRDWTHQPGNLPEWEDPNGSSSPIPLERIMPHVGMPTEQAVIVRDMDSIDTLLRSY